MMQAGTMRAIDFWVGVPICFVLTIVYRLQRIVGWKDPELDRPPKRVLLIQLAEMGTMVVAYPALRKLKELCPDATIYFLSFEQIRRSVEILGVVARENVLTIDASSFKFFVRDTLRFLWRARRIEIDTVINLETFVRYSSVLGYLSGARKRVGFHRFNQEGVYTGDFLTHKVLYNAHIHAGHTFLDLIHALHAPAGQVPLVKRARKTDDLSIPRRKRQKDVEQAVWSKLKALDTAIDPSKKLVVLNPNASKLFPMRKLPLEDYAELARRLLEDPEVYLLVTGLREEKPDAAHICQAVRSTRALDLAGETSFEELLSLFDLADVLITNDSGPAHFACLTGIHVIVFFGPELPNRYRPLTDRCDVVYADYTCSPCVGPYNQRLTPCNDNQCLKHIDIADVCRIVRTRLCARS